MQSFFFFLTNLPNDSHYPQTIFSLVTNTQETKSITIISQSQRCRITNATLSLNLYMWWAKTNLVGITYLIFMPTTTPSALVYLLSFHYITLQRVSWLQFSSVQFSRSVVFNSLRPRESQHARPPCPSPTPGVHSNSSPSSQWCHPDISSSIVPFSSCPQSLPASESFPMSRLFSWGGQSTGVSTLAPFLPKNTQGWSPSEWTGWISLQSKGLSRVFSNTTVQKHQFLALSFLHSPTLTSIHDHWKNHSLD